MKKDKNNIYDVSPYFLYDKFDAFSEIIDGTEYYFKHSFNPLYELVADEIFHLLGISCVNHEIAKIGSKYLLFSKSFKKNNCNYYTGLDLYTNTDKEKLKVLGIDRNNLNTIDSIWNLLMLKDYNEKEIYEVLNDLIKQYTMSVILLDPDFHFSNWTIEENNKHIKLVPKYDNECAFQSDIFGMSFAVDVLDNKGSSIDSLKYFLSYTTKTQSLIVYNLINRTNEDLVIKAFYNVINKYNNLFRKDENKYLNNILTIFNKQKNDIMMMIKEMENSHGR